MAVARASALVVVLMSPNAELVRYTANTNVMMMVLNGWVPQSYMAHVTTRRQFSGVSARAVRNGSAPPSGCSSVDSLVLIGPPRCRVR